MDKQIKEPAIGGRVNTIQIGAAGDRLIFPHVDSCLGICLLLANGSMVGGHVPMQLGANDPMAPAANAERIMVNMLRVVALQCQGSAVQKLITVGDDTLPAPFGYDTNRLNQLTNPANGHVHLDSSAHGGGVDMVVDGPQQTVRVQLTNNPMRRLYFSHVGAMVAGNHVL